MISTKNRQKDLLTVPVKPIHRIFGIFERKPLVLALYFSQYEYT